MELILFDVALAARVLRRDKRFTIATLATLALGIGATTAVFSTIYGVLIRPLPYPDSGQLVHVYQLHEGAPLPPGDAPLANTTMYAWRRNLKSVDDLAAYCSRGYTVTLDGEAVRIHGAEASSSLFPLLRARAQLGRFFASAEDAPNANGVVVISDRLWRRRFDARGDAVGRVFIIDSKPHTIVGVASPDGAMMPLSSQMSAATAQPRFATTVLAAFATLGSRSPARPLRDADACRRSRRRELGVRVALGASRRSRAGARAPRRTAARIARHGRSASWPSGVHAADEQPAVRRHPLDAAAYLAAPCVLLPIAALACLAPAFRAAATDPAVVLRGD